MAENAEPRKRLKEIKTEIAALKQTLTTLRTERENLKANVEKQQAKKTPETEKPA